MEDTFRHLIGIIEENFFPKAVDKNGKSLGNRDKFFLELKQQSSNRLPLVGNEKTYKQTVTVKMSTKNCSTIETIET